MKSKWRMRTPAIVLIFIACLGCSRILPISGSMTETAPSGTPDSLTNASDSSLDDPLAYQKYKMPVTLHIGFKVFDSKLPPGDSNDNNPVTRYFEKLTNIHVVHSWEAKSEDAFGQKVDLAIASNDIPDAMVVDRDQLRTLVENGMVADLTDTYAKYASKLVRSIYDSTNGLALQGATSNGRLYALPNVAIEADATSLLWVRKDWLDKFNLNPPKTLADIEHIAQAFITRDPDGDKRNDTVGLTGYKQIVYGQKPLFNGFDAIFSAFHAFPKNWLRGPDGNIVYGSILPENKQALSLLADWYKRGLIDHNFALYKDSEEPILENKTGLFFGPWWMPYYPLDNAVEADTKAEWRAYPAPLDSEGSFVTHMAPATDRYLVIRKGYPYPEAAVKLVNVFTRLERSRDPNKEEVKNLNDYVAKSGIQLRNFYPFDLLLDYSNSIEKRYLSVQKAMSGEIDPAALDPDARNVYNMIAAENENPKKNMDSWKAATAYEYGASVLAATNMQKVYGVFHGSTPTMVSKWAKLERLENETYLKMIIGDQDVASFDDFVKQWKQQGGDQITEEVSDRVNSK